jgi:hypothetical protein
MSLIKSDNKSTQQLLISLSVVSLILGSIVAYKNLKKFDADESANANRLDVIEDDIAEIKTTLDIP